MIPAPAAVARPCFPASTSTTSAPSPLAAYAHEAPTMPEPTTISRNGPHPAHVRRMRQQQRPGNTVVFRGLDHI
jgi:hypothetical protein